MTKDEIGKATYQKLVAFCPSIGIKYNYQKKNELKQLILEQLSKKIKSKKEVSEDSKDLKETDKDIQRILSTKDVSKSQIMRMLFDYGLNNCAEIARLTNSHYSFVYTVITKHVKS